ncbi:hypothetical protein [Paraburkholderia phenazinium]|jgi:hypothetical protein|uniref:Uncharacterized protein n=1 Tax=Paraburkholderia phenazinium TaxID=60549 RepID=A0A1G8CMU5_9BURK|nr:hypothetical protein [Paraburkholderia phenazinium]SDH46798.1 hypothetical protein SAMN05216466_11074 [Paraburkholderia phenazinium]
MVQMLSSGSARLAREAQIVFGGNFSRKLIGLAIVVAGYSLITSHVLQQLPGR